MINYNYADEKTWDLICSGATCGIFQCESKLVQKWLKKIRPRNIWELSAVLAIVRPGPLMSGFADTYVSYKNQEQTFESFGHDIIDQTFHSTHHVLLYQEQLILLGQRLAWPDKPEMERLVLADTLRKAVGKKNQKKILEIGEEFVKGCRSNGVDEETANKLFEVIKRSGRYVFNLSHSIQYAYVAFKTAYLKTHYMEQFYATYLTYTKYKRKDKWQEMENLVREAKIFGIDIEKPNINLKNPNFLIRNGKIYYGLSHIKSFGSKTIDLVNSLPEINDWRQVFLLCCTDEYGKKLNKKASEGLICSGAFSDTGVSRKSLANLVKAGEELSPTDMEIVKELLPEYNDIQGFKDILRRVSELARSNRKSKISTIAQLLNVDEYDSPAWIEKNEKNFLGAVITASAVDDKGWNITDKCSDIHDGVPLWTLKQIGVVIDKIKTTVTKKGKNPGARMAIIEVHDSSGGLDNIPIFPEKFLEFEDLLIENRTVLMDLKKGKGGWFVERMLPL